MRHRRALVPLAVFALALLLLPGWSLAAVERQPRVRSVEESAFTVALAWVSHVWETLTGSHPTHAEAAAGCGIDPNGTHCG